MASLSLDDSQAAVGALSEDQSMQQALLPPPPPRAQSSRPKRKAQVAQESAARLAQEAAAESYEASSAIGHVSSPTADDDDEADAEEGRIDEAEEEKHPAGDAAAQQQRILQHIASPVVQVAAGGEAKKARRSPEATAKAVASASPHAAAFNGFDAPALARPVIPLLAPQSPPRILHDSGSGSGSQDVRSHKSPQQLQQSMPRDSGSDGRGRTKRRGAPPRHSISSSDKSDSGGSGRSSRSSSTDSSSGSEDTTSSSDNDEPLNSQEQAERARELATGQPQGDDHAAAAFASDDLDGGLSAMYESPLFRCTSTHIDSILQMLNAIRLEKKKDQVCRLTLGTLGMKVSCELMGSRAMCAKAYLKRDLFSDYRLNVQMLRAGGMDPNQPHQQGQDYTCHLSLNSLIDSLMILGSGQKDTSKDLQSCVLHLEIQAQNHPLIVTLDGDTGGDRHNVTTAELQMRDQVGTDSQDGFHIGKDKLLLAVVQATPFSHAFSELDMSDVEVLTMTAKQLENNKTLFSMSVKGHGGMETELELSTEPGAGVFYGDKIELPNRGFKLNYDIKHLRPCIRALHKAQMSNFRIAIDGLMSIQHILPISSTEGVSSQWVEFFITAKEVPETDDLMPRPLPPDPMAAYNGAGAGVAAGGGGVDEGMIVRDDDEEKHADGDISMRSPSYPMEYKVREQHPSAMQ